MFAISLDIALSLAGGYALASALHTKNSGKKSFLILLTIAEAALILFVNSRFISGKYWWTASVIFSTGILTSYPYSFFKSSNLETNNLILTKAINNRYSQLN